MQIFGLNLANTVLVESKNIPLTLYASDKNFVVKKLSERSNFKLRLVNLHSTIADSEIFFNAGTRHFLSGFPNFPRIF